MGSITKFILADFFKANKFILIVYIITNILIYPIQAIYLPKLYSTLINRVATKKFNLLSEGSKYQNTVLKRIDLFQKQGIPSLLIFITITAVVVASIYRFRYYLYDVIFPRYQMWIRKEIFQKTLERRSTDFEEQKVGKEMMRTEYIVWTVNELFKFLLTTMVEYSTISIIIISYLFYLDYTIGLLAVFQLVVIFILIAICYRQIKASTYARVDAYYEIADNIDNSFTNLSNVLINNQTQNETHKNKKHSEDWADKSTISGHYLNNLSFIVRISTLLIFLVIYYQSFRLYQKNKFSATTFSTVFIVLMHFQNYIYNKAGEISGTIDRKVEMEYNLEYLKDLLEESKNSKNLTGIITKGQIEFKNVTFQYKEADTPVLNNLNLTIPAHQKTAILGKSGSGKSTLIKLLIRFYPLDNPVKKQKEPSSSITSPITSPPQILIDNIPHTDINIQYLRKQVNYVNQNTTLFDEDVFYNIKYGNKNDSEYNFVAPSISAEPGSQEDTVNKKITQILQKYDLLSIYDNLEDGLHTKAGPKGTKLSHGMQKVTIILRGLMRHSQILIFDEPLAGLDQKTREKVIKLITGETQNRTVIIITHDPEILPYMDHQVNLQELQTLSPSI